MEKEMKVAALCNGTVIDHIPGQITIGNNLDSQKMGSKGIIKISDRFLDESEANKIALIAPHAKINIIRNYEVVEKRNITLPEEINGIVHCPNPKCITNNQPVTTRFHVITYKDGIRLRCHYCEKEVEQNNIKIN